MVDNFLIWSMGQAQKPIYYFSHGSQTILDRYLFLVNAQKNLEAQAAELSDLRTKLARLEDVEMENRRLREALEFRTKIDQPLLSAHVVSYDVSSDYFGIRVDRGHRDGVKVGMGVISPSGLVGRVLRVTEQYADILTLVDPTSNIDAVIQRSRARGIITGQSKQLTCKMKYIDKLDDVAVNDTVVSSGFGNIFPKGLLVGYVTFVEPATTGILQMVTIKSAVDIYRLEEVFIVLPPTQPEKTS